MLAQDSLKAEIVTAKSSEMNVMIPAGEDFVEQVHSLLPIRSNFSNPVLWKVARILHDECESGSWQLKNAEIKLVSGRKKLI